MALGHRLAMLATVLNTGNGPVARAMHPCVPVVGTLAAAIALAMLAGVWVQWRYAPVPAQDPSRGWRDGI